MDKKLEYRLFASPLHKNHRVVGILNGRELSKLFVSARQKY